MLIMPKKSLRRLLKYNLGEYNSPSFFNYIVLPISDVMLTCIFSYMSTSTTIAFTNSSFFI